MRKRLLVVAIAAFAAVTQVSMSFGLTAGDGDSMELGLPPRDGLVEQLGPLQAELRTRHESTFGGLWIDESGNPIVAVVGDDAAMRALAQSRLSITPQFEQVRFSEADLNALHASILDAADEHFLVDGVQLSAVETDVIGNRVNVVAVDATLADLASISERFGAGVVATSVASPAVGSACSISNCPNPLKAGLRLYQNGVVQCMSGFIMRSVVSTYYLATAGHCSTAGEVRQHPSGVNIGSITHQGWVDNSPADVALISISSAQKSNKLCRGVESCTIVSMTSREDPPTQEVIGEQVCIQRQNGTTCAGTLVSTDTSLYVCKPGGTDCRLIISLRRTTAVTAGGDSGGPVFYATKAMGSVSANYPGTTNTLYSHIKNVESWFIMQTQLTP